MSTGIDATAVLGLAGKASQVFAQPGTYLSFPLAPVGFTRTALRALANDPLSADGAAAAAQFSWLVNEIPDGPVWLPDGDRIWDVYGDVLATAQLAEGTRTAEEEATYQRAYRLLYSAGEDDAVVDSPMALTYEQYRDAYRYLAEEYNNRKSQAEISDDAAVRDRWVRDEPVLRERVDDAEEAWAAGGQRAAVEDARRMVRELGSRSPASAWAAFRALYDPDLPEIYFRTAEGGTYLPTSYIPSDVVAADWPVISMSRPELAAMAASAPADLRARLSAGTPVTAVESVSFEYSSLILRRSWFTEDLFGLRFWRFFDQQRVLSDGGDPPRGECSAFVEGLVLARNIMIRSAATVATQENLGFLPKRRLTDMIPAIRPYSASLLKTRVAARQAVITAAVAADADIHDHRTIPARQRRDHRSQPAPPGKRAPAGTDSGVGGRRNETVPVRGRRPAPPPRSPAAPTPATVATDPEEIYIIAFICRWLPKSPDPDNELTWQTVDR